YRKESLNLPIFGTAWYKGDGNSEVELGIQKGNMRLSRILLFAVLALIVVVSLTLDLYFDWLWFEEVGKATVFLTALWARGVVSSAAFLAVFAFLYLNLRQANRGKGRIQIGIPTPAGQITAYTLGDEQIR